MSDENPGALPENYPHQYVKTAPLKNGGTITMRPIRPDDDELMLELFKTFSPQTIYHRFFSYINMTPARVKRLTNIDYKKHLAIVAECESDGGRMLMGVARYNTPADGPPGEVEMAIVVGDPFQCLGVGTALLEVLLRAGKDGGFKLLYGFVHFDNKAVPRLFEKLDQRHRIRDNGTEWRYEVDTADVAG